MRNLHSLVKKKHVIGIEDVKFKKDHLCGGCEAGKMTRANHPSKTIMTTSQPFELLHMDLFGPTHYSTLTTTACLYGFVIVDDYSRYIWVHIILYKTEVQDVFRRFANRAMNNYGMKIKHIRSDNGTKFKNTGLDLYLDTMGITHEFSAPYTPQQNGIVERKNRTLIEMARTMLDEYKTPRKLWPEAIDTACHIINRVYIHKLLNKTSYELLTGRSQMSVTSEYLVLGAGSRIPITSQNLHLKLTKASCSVMERIHTLTESSTSFTTKSLKLWTCDLMKPMVHKEKFCQVHLMKLLPVNLSS